MKKSTSGCAGHCRLYVQAKTEATRRAMRSIAPDWEETAKVFRCSDLKKHCLWACTPFTVLRAKYGCGLPRSSIQIWRQLLPFGVPRPCRLGPKSLARLVGM